MIRSIPYWLIFIRLALTITLLVDAFDGITARWFVPVLCVAVFLDGIDGMLARRLHAATRRLRQADSTLDFIMVVIIMFCGWLTRREAVSAYICIIAALIIGDLISFLPPILKFGYLPPYHTYSARITGGFLFLAALELFSQNRAGFFMMCAFVIGFLSLLDRIAITLILPAQPSGDINGFWHAMQIRKRGFMGVNTAAIPADDDPRSKLSDEKKNPLIPS